MGHARRRDEAVPLIESKLRKHLTGIYSDAEQENILRLLTDHDSLVKMPVNEFIDVRTVDKPRLPSSGPNRRACARTST